MDNNQEDLKKVDLLVKQVQQVDDRDDLTLLLFAETEKIDQELLEAKQLAFDKEERKFVSDKIFTIYDKKKDYERFIAEIEKNYEPKFSLFLIRLGNLCNWSEEEKKSYRKPRIAAITILEVIYRRFPEGLLEYINVHNKYVGFFKRRTKNYKLLNEEGILLLESFIDDANISMAESKDYYDFRKRMNDKYKIGYQMQFFDN